MKSSRIASWRTGLMNSVGKSGPEGAAAADYIRQKGTRVGVHNQSAGARWTIDRRIELHPHYADLPPDDPYAIALVIHEVRHLQQGVLTALSVYGELEAWQLQFGFLKRITGSYQSDPSREAIIEGLMQTPLGWGRPVLEHIRYVMQSYAGRKYRIDLLPLYPLPAEIRYRITRREPVPFKPNQS
jgi:hypothetical protein